MTTDVKILSSWRRQIARVRVANAYFTIGGAATLVWISSQIALLFYDRLQSGRALLDYDPRFALVGSLLILALPSVYYIRRMFRPELLPLASLEALEDIGTAVLPQIRSRIGLSSRPTVELRILTRGGTPISVRHNRGKLKINLHPDIAALVLLNPRTLGALLAHELTHSHQWDTRLGYVWYKVSLVGSVVLLVGYGAAAAILLVIVAGGAIIWGIQAVAELIPALGFFILGVPYAMASAAFCFVVRRWMEYSADISAVLAGYGDEMIALLNMNQTSTKRPLLRRLFSAYPTPAERLARLTKILGSDKETTSLRVDERFEIIHPQTKIRFRDYAHGLFFSVIPAMAPMVAFSLIFVTIAARIVTLP